MLPQEVLYSEFASEAGFDNAFQYSDLQQCKSVQARLNENVTLDVICWSSIFEFALIRLVHQTIVDLNDMPANQG